MRNILSSVALKNLESVGYYICRDYFDREVIERLIPEIISDISRTTIEEKVNLNNGNFDGIRRKLTKSEHNGIGESYAQHLITSYIGVDVPFRSVATPLLRIRDDLMGTGQNQPGYYREYWDAIRIHEYYSGGCYMATHRDTYFSQTHRNISARYIQASMCLSVKGVDYKEGGFIIERDDDCIDLDAQLQLGDICLFDGNLRHGIQPVDPNSPLTYVGNARRAMLVNSYKRI